MRYRYIILLIFVLQVRLSASPSDKIYSEDEIFLEEIIYSEVDYTNALKIWQIELGLTPMHIRAADKILKKRLKADVYSPPQTLKPKGFVMFMFGSAFLPTARRKSKKSIKLLCTRLAQEGYVTASIDYRLMNVLTPSFAKAGYVATQDAKCALQYFANNHNRFNIDPNNFFVGGISAGAFTAINAAFLDDGESLLGRENKYEKMYGGLYSTCPYPKVRYKIRGVINVSGAVYDLAILNNNIPIISFHASNDIVVPYDKNLPFTPLMNRYNLFVKNLAKNFIGKLKHKFYEAEMFPVFGSSCIADRLKKNCSFSEFDGYGHSLIVTRYTKRPTDILEPILDEMVQFIAFQISKKRNHGSLHKLIRYENSLF